MLYERSVSAIPIQEYTVLRTTDREEAHNAISESLCPMNVEYRTAKAPFAFHLCAADLGRVKLLAIDYSVGCKMDICADASDSYYNVEIPIDGISSIQHVGKEITLLARKCGAITSPSEKTTWSDDGLPYKALSVSIDKELVEKKVLEFTGKQPIREIVFDPKVDLTTDMGKSFLSLITNAFKLRDQSVSIIDDPQCAALYEDLIISALLVNFSHSHSGHLEKKAPHSSNKAVGLAEDFMEANSDFALSTSEVAAAAGVSIRSLQRTFSMVKGTTPMRFLKDLRLRRARTRMLTAGLNSTITQIALMSGFSHLGEFSVEYRKKFGETPTETLSRSRDN